MIGGQSCLSMFQLYCVAGRLQDYCAENGIDYGAISADIGKIAAENYVNTTPDNLLSLLIEYVDGVTV